MKYFIVTVDTEGDNLWSYSEGENIKTQNAEYLPRFQCLCESFGFKPVYLTNFEMANSATFVEEAREWLLRKECEIGIHLHAWNNPPIFDLVGPFRGNPYLIEYGEEIMHQKFEIIYNLLVERFGVRPVSHRAGRWAMDHRYFNILKDFGIKVDCSYTPGIDWSRAMGKTCGGCNYSNEPNTVQTINEVMEVPVTLRRFRNFSNGTWKHRLKSLLTGENVWLRPATSSAATMKRVMDIVEKDGTQDYVEFMIHSSEVMPNGSPYFRTEKDIDKEYDTIKEVFDYAKSKGYTGITLSEYYDIHK